MHRSLVRTATALALLVAAAGAAAAQDPAFTASHPLRTGTYIFAGGASVNSSHAQGEDGRRTAIDLRPTVSRFVTPRWALGASAALGYASRDGIDTTTIGIGPVVHHYFGGAGDRLLPFVSVSTPLQRTSYGGDADRTDSFVSVAGEAGGTDLLVPHVGVSGALYYQSSRVRFDDDLPSSGSHRVDAFGLRFGLTVFVH